MVHDIKISLGELTSIKIRPIEKEDYQMKNISTLQFPAILEIKSRYSDTHNEPYFVLGFVLAETEMKQLKTEIEAILLLWKV